jgi:hypothetical protein
MRLQHIASDRGNRMRKVVRFAAAAMLLSPLAQAAETPSYSPYANRDFPERLLWGDTHLHTCLSADATSFGNREICPEQAYRVARGETVTAHNGMDVRLSRPLDFLVLSDHGEYLGVFPRLRQGDERLLGTETGRRWAKMMAEAGSGENVQILMEWGAAIHHNQDLIGSKEFSNAIWREVVANADRFNEPGRFTAIAGYEWTSMPDGDNLHRVVLFADGSDKTAQVVPFSALDSTDPEALWGFLDDYEKRTGGQALAIPHNGNVSGGLMYAPRDVRGEPFDRDYAERRIRWEPVMEVTQYKGDSETHPLNSPKDEFAGYEIWDKGNLGGTRKQTAEMMPFMYARSALRIGLQQEAALGVNPFKFGLIGSTDAHTGFAAAEENNFWGKSSKAEASAHRWEGYLAKNTAMPEISYREYEMAASGYMAVWARENTRAAIFEAVKRKEVYATTGPRIMLRFFGGYDFALADAATADLAAIGYARGVPMGGELAARADSRAPQFLIAAARDPLSANLDRIQVVKGWVDAQGESHERVYDVAWGGARKPDRKGRLPAVGSTVDVDNASWSNTIGAGELATVWSDPDFDATQRAFYYVRVIEIPTPRWTAYDRKFFGIDMPAEIPMVTQERAYSSPIWYSPGGA